MTTDPSKAGRAPSTPAEVRTQPSRLSLDPLILYNEIQRRKEALQRARNRMAQLPPGQTNEPLAWRIRSLEEQVSRLESLKGAVLSWSTPADARAREERENHAASLLLECLTLDPLQPSLAKPSQFSSLLEETLGAWDPVRSANREGDCVEALAQYDTIAGKHQEAHVPSDVRVIRALCLSRQERRLEAIRILEPIVMDQAKLLDYQYLQYQLANWLFQEGLLDRAEEGFESLLEGSTERSYWTSLAKLRLEQIPLKRGDSLPSGSTPEGPESVPEPSLGSTTQEFRHPAERTPSNDSSLPDTLEMRAAHLEEAQRLLENELYGEAIAAFQGLLGTEFETLAQEGIQQAQDRLAENRRREAAHLVLKARKEPQVSKRKDLLVQALELLQEMNSRYPGNRYAAKINQNIQDVIGQIQKIDPYFESAAAGPLPQQ